MINKPKQQRPVPGGSTNLWGNILNANMDLMDNFASKVVDELGTHSQELSRLEQEKINMSDLNTIVADRVDNYIETDAKPQMDEYIETDAKPQMDEYIETVEKPKLGAYTTQKKSEINTHVEMVSKVDINEFTEVQKTELDSHEKTKEVRLDTYADGREAEMTVYADAEIDRINATGIDVKVDKTTYASDKAIMEANISSKLDSTAFDSYSVIAGKGTTGGGKLSSNPVINIVSANDGIVVNSDNIELKPATTSIIGGVKPDGTTITVDAVGKITTAEKWKSKNNYIPIALDANDIFESGEFQLTRESQTTLPSISVASQFFLTCRMSRENDTGYGIQCAYSYNPAQNGDNIAYRTYTGGTTKLWGPWRYLTKQETQIIAGSGLTGGGDLTASRTINVVSLDDGITVNADNIKLNIVNDLVTTSTTKPLSSAQGKLLQDNKVDKTTQIIAGTGLSGGGALSSNSTLNIASANDGIIANADNIQLDTQNNLTSTSITKPLSANMGKVLQDTKLNLTGGTITGVLTAPAITVSNGTSSAYIFAKYNNLLTDQISIYNSPTTQGMYSELPIGELLIFSRNKSTGTVTFASGNYGTINGSTATFSGNVTAPNIITNTSVGTCTTLFSGTQQCGQNIWKDTGIDIPTTYSSVVFEATTAPTYASQNFEFSRAQLASGDYVSISQNNTTTERIIAKIIGDRLWTYTDGGSAITDNNLLKVYGIKRR